MEGLALSQVGQGEFLVPMVGGLHAVAGPGKGACPNKIPRVPTARGPVIEGVKHD